MKLSAKRAIQPSLAVHGPCLSRLEIQQTTYLCVAPSIGRQCTEHLLRHALAACKALAKKQLIAGLERGPREASTQDQRLEKQSSYSLLAICRPVALLVQKQTHKDE